MRVRQSGWAIAMVAMAAMAGTAAMAQQATQVVRFQVSAVNELAVSGDPAPLVVSAAVAGSAPESVTGTGTTWAISTNESNQKVTASLSAAMPVGLRLEVSLGAPPGASGHGHVTLGTIGADVVTGISRTAASALPISYRLSAEPTAAVTAQARVVTFTIVSGA